jgi:DNA polymerase III subunit delta
MAELKSIYLISGEDDAKIDSWRTRLRLRAEKELGPGGLELFDPKTSSPEDVAASLATLTFGEGTRYLLVDDAGAWKAPALEPLLPLLADMPPDLVLVLIVRGKALKALTGPVGKAGGELHHYEAQKPWQMAPWVVEHAKKGGLKVDPDAARTLTGIVGASDKRLAREIEKLAIYVHPASRATTDDVEEVAAGQTVPKVYDLADAVVAGDRQGSVALAEELIAAGEEPARLAFPIIGRLREVHGVVALLDSGVAEKDLGQHIKGPPWKLKKAVALARKADRETLERALGLFADFETDTRGGAPLGERTAFTLALARAAA